MLQKIAKLFEKTPRTNDTSFSFRGQSRVHSKQCIGPVANQYSCLTYTAWVETLYAGIGRRAMLLSLHERSYNGIYSKIRISVRHAFSLATIPISYSHDRFFCELKFCIVFYCFFIYLFFYYLFCFILFFPCI